MSDFQGKIAVSVRMEETDLRRANLWFTLKQRGLLVIIPIYMLGAIFFYWSDFPLLAVLFILSTVLTPFGIVWGVGHNTRRTFSDLKDSQKNCTYIFSEMGLETVAEKSHGQTSWDNFLKAVESKYSFNLFFQRNLFFVVPKRFIESSADLNHIREILKNNLGDKAELQSGH